MEYLAQIASGIPGTGIADMREVLSELPDGAEIPEEALKAAAKNEWRGAAMMEMLLNKKNVNIVITEEVLTAAAGNWGPGKEIMMLLLEQRGADVIITEEVLKAAAGNGRKEIMMLLLEQCRADVIITEEVLKVAAGNERWDESKTMTLLLEQRGRDVVITEKVVKAAAGNNWNGEKIMMLLFEQCGTGVMITEEVVTAAAGNKWNGEKVMMVLLERGTQVVITEEMVNIIVRHFGEHVLAFFFEQYGAQVKVTEEMVKIITDRHDDKIMMLLLEQLGADMMITEKMLMEAVRNDSQNKFDIMTALLKQRGADSMITEEVLKVAVGNRNDGERIMKLLLKQRGADSMITEEVLKVAAGNKRDGKRIITLLLEQSGVNFMITEERLRMIKDGFGEEMMRLLLEKKSSEVTLRGMSETAAKDERTLLKTEIRHGYEKRAGIFNDSTRSSRMSVGSMSSTDQIQAPTNESSDNPAMNKSVANSQYRSAAGYVTDSSEESDASYDDNISVAETNTAANIIESTSPPAKQFRLSEMNEELLHPVRYNTKLRKLQAQVWKESAISQQSLGVGKQNDRIISTPDSRLQECQRILNCIQQNITFLQETGFCTSSATILQVDPTRTQVALVRSVDLDKVAHLGTCIDDDNTASKNLAKLRQHYIDLFGELWSSVGGDSIIVGLRILDLIMVTHVYSHMGTFNGEISEDKIATQIFQVSDQASSVMTNSELSGKDIVAFRRRTLKCLNGFLNGEHVWVLHGCDTDLTDDTELWLSSTPDTFAKIWGPMWTISNKGKPGEILRYDLENGSVIRTVPSPENSHDVVEATSSEEFCHWISNHELQQLERTSDLTSIPQITRPRLLIGACAYSVIPNTACSHNLTDATQKFNSRGYLRHPGSSPGK